MTRAIERFLHLHPGDAGRGLLLFSYLFLIIASYVVGKVARDALFLDRFQAIQLPYVDIASAVLVGFVVAGYVRLGRHTSLRNLISGSLLFLAANAALFWWLAFGFEFSWLYPVIYIWVGVYGVLAPAQVWTLANYVLTTREAKRLFGLVGSGAISGWIFGGYFSKSVAQAFGTESLLLGMAVFLVLCAGLVVLIGRHERATAAAQADSGSAAGQEEPQNLRQSLRAIARSPYLQAIAAVICASSFVTTLAGWQFKAIAKQFLVEKDMLAAFFGSFNFYAGILCLLTQLLLTARVLRRYGIGPALFVVPVALLAGSVGVLAWGTLAAAIVLKGSDQVLRYSIDKSSVELLYLPIPSGVKLQVKSFIDTVVWRLGDGLAGVTLLVFATYLGLAPRAVSWISLALIAGWMAAAWVARRQYVAGLRQSIREHRLDAERASADVLDRSATDIIATNLQATDPQAILYALSLFEVSRQQAAHPAVRDLLSHPAAAVRHKAVAILSAAGDKAVLPRIEELLNDEDIEVRTEALRYLTRHAHLDPLARIKEVGDFPDFSVRSGIVAFLAAPGPRQDLEVAGVILAKMIEEPGPNGPQTRLEAARLLQRLPDHFEAELARLLGDPEVEVQREAIRAVGAHRKRRFVPVLLERLGEPHLTRDCTEALAACGDHIVGTLRDHLGDATVPLKVRGEIARVLGRIGTPAAARALEEHLLEGDTTLRFGVISSLNKLRQLHPEVALDAQMVETALAAEMLGHYRSYQIFGTLGRELEAHEAMAKALGESIEQEVERIFRLLGLLQPQYDFHSAYVGLQSGSPVVHDNALEFLDNVLKPPMRKMLVPLIDAEVDLMERARLANRLVGARLETREEAVAVLLRSEDPWLKSCGAYAVGTLGLRSFERELDTCLDHPDPLLRETARQAKLRLATVPGAPARPA